MKARDFGSLEYHARDRDNGVILRTCRCRWVRNKDIARSVGMTPAGAKRRNDFLEDTGLLERRRRGKEVQYCTTILAYIANLELVVEEPLAALGVARAYLDLTRAHQLKMLGEDEFPEFREVLATIAYMWPLETVSNLHVDVEGFNRPGATILQADRMPIPVPVLTADEFESVARELDEMSSENGDHRGEGFDAWREISKGLLTRDAWVADYRELRHRILDRERSEERRGQAYAVLKRFKGILEGMKMKGPLHVPITAVVDDMLADTCELGLREAEIPESVPVGMPRFKVVQDLGDARG